MCPSTPLATDTPDPTVSPIIISEVIHTQAGTEIVVIKNISGSEQNLEGMALLNPVTMEHVVFPNVTLPPGGSFKVYNGSEAGKIAEGIKWLDEPVLRQSGDHVVLLNPAGRAIWYYVNP
ncbi:MAG: lamin tail domain-containing protein [Candidatus Sumerlaeia bacterium]|nr:lamin tail domain-containing protein [Candidatus Sumerlaeia bacterium]